MGRTEVSDIRARDKGQLSSRQNCGQRPLFFFWALPQQSHRDKRGVPYLRLHQPIAHTVCPALARLHPTERTGPPKLLTVAFPNEWPDLAQASDLPSSSQTSNSWPQRAPSPHTSCFVAPGLARAAAGICPQSGFAWVPPSLAQVAAT